MRAPRARPSTLLLVEGIDSAAERFQSILRATAPDDFEVTRAANLAEAISQLESSSPDCAIVNIDLVGAGSLEIFDTLAAGSSSEPC